MLHGKNAFSRIILIFNCDAKPFALGPGVGLDTQCHNFLLPIPTCWYLKTLKNVFPPTPNLKFSLPPTRTPKTSQWNIGCIWSPTQNVRVGNVHFIFWVLISFGGQRKPSFQWNMGLRMPDLTENEPRLSGRNSTGIQQNV